MLSSRSILTIESNKCLFYSVFCLLDNFSLCEGINTNNITEYEVGDNSQISKKFRAIKHNNTNISSLANMVFIEVLNFD